uniref:OSJNBa0032N05.7 protein n=1 Tax=Oryza sativa subsp. japonica TaxID=39947 RepID=Q7XKP2_ORYSJ|nr:OSJNBa0032N05.7 [Oryza sativa Japonica Group]
MAAEEGAEPSAPVVEAGVAPSASAPMPQPPPSAPAALTGQAPNTVDAAKAAVAARALQTRAEILSTSQLATTPGCGTNQALNQVAMAWTQPPFDPSMAAHQAPPFGARQPDTVVQPHTQAMTSLFATTYPQPNGPSQQGTVSKAGGEKGLPLSGGIKIRPIPPQFKFPSVPWYSGETDPKEFLSIYESAIEAAHSDENTKAKLIAFTHGSNCVMSLSLTFEAPMRSRRRSNIYSAFARGRGIDKGVHTSLLVIPMASSGHNRGARHQRRFGGAARRRTHKKNRQQEPQTLEHLLRIIDGYARGEEDYKRWQAIQAEYDKAFIAAAQAQVQAQVAEPAPLAIRQSQPANQGQPPRPSQSPMTWRKFRTDRAGKAVMAVEEVQALRKEFDAQQAGSHQYPVRRKLKMPGPASVIMVKGLQPSTTSKGDLAAINIAVHNVEAEPHDRAKHMPKPAPHGKVIRVQVDDADPTRFVSLGGDMGEREAENILEVLKKNIDIFAWGPDEVGGVSADLIMHYLAVKPDAKPRKQKLRKMSVDRQEAAKAEVQKLLKTGVIQEIDHPEWLANPVLVRKSNGKWRMCVDFTDLNKACPKDDFPLPRIDQLVDSTAGCELMSFLDAYSGYHQIHMNPAHIPKTAFITPFGTFCHLRMPFGLRNAGATFARLVYKVLYKQLGRNVEAYVDDIVVKSRKAFDHVSDLQETFDNLRVAGMKLNPEKCVFGVRAGKLLGFLVSERGIEANPEKIDAIQQMKPPSSVREVQKLAGQIAALSRFLSKAAERGLPFFKTLRGAGKFSWTPECQAAFDEVKQYPQSPPTLVSPALGSELLLYLAASPVAVSAALVQETESGQKPVYFISEALQGAKLRYIEMEKFTYALVMASRKLKHYFQAHKVTVPSQYPLGEVLRGKEITGWLSKWVAELSPFDLHFVARTAIKSQVLADFVAKWTPAFASETEPVEQPWVMYSDSSWSHKGAGAVAVLTSPGGMLIRYAARLQFDTTNNTAEYKAVLLGLRKAKALGVRRLLIRTDSKRVASLLDKSFEAKEEGMKRYLEAIRSMEKCFAGITVEHLPRGQNEEADALAKSAASGGPHSPGILFEVLYAPSVPTESLDIMAVDQAELGEDPEDWRTPFVKYLKNGWLPEDEAEAKRLQLKAARYKLVSG